MLLKELHIVLQKFTELCESNPDEFSLSYDEISERLCKFNEWNAKLVEIEKEFVFATLDDEIEYYKNLKPEFQKFGIYYDIIYNLELGRSPMTLEYYKRKLKRLDKEFKEIKHYFVYYRSNSTDKDAVYFVKNSKENHIFALVKANSMLTKYLIHKTDTRTADDIIASSPKVKWNLGDHDIMELAKSFHGLGYAVGTLSDIAESLGRFFGKEMKNIYGKSHNITNRANPGRFMEKCANWLKKFRN
jgi:RteC protein